MLIWINGDTFGQAVYVEAIAMVEEYQQAVSVANLGGIRDVQGLYPQLGLRSSPQVPVFQFNVFNILNFSFYLCIIEHSHDIEPEMW